MTEREEFEAWYIKSAFDYCKDPLGTRDCSLQWSAWQAARSTPKHGEVAKREPNSGHGHVFPRPDGVRARCGGPGMCEECSKDAALSHAPSVEPAPAVQADDTQVICPACANQFRAIPPQVQSLLLASWHEPPFMSPPAPQVELRDAATAVVKRWHTPLWKDVPATAEYIARLSKALEAMQFDAPPSPPLQQVEPGWQPIETAPEVGVLMLWFPAIAAWIAGPWRGCWSHVYEEWVIHAPCEVDRKGLTFRQLPMPTHWMPLPKEPTT